jgi:hypothetical protein
MKKYFSALLLVFICILSASARIRNHYQMGLPLDSIPRPFVKLNSGQVIYPESIEELRKKIKVNDNTSYNKENVAEYSTGTHYYRRLEKKYFAEKKYQGRINIWNRLSVETYTTTSSSGGSSMRTRVVEVLYLQKGDSGKLVGFSNANVRQMIPQSEPAYKYIQKYDHKRWAARRLQWISLGVIAAGLATAIASDTNDKLAALGGAMIPTGLVGVFVGMFKRASSTEYLSKAVASYNGTLEPPAR